MINIIRICDEVIEALSSIKDSREIYLEESEVANSIHELHGIRSGVIRKHEDCSSLSRIRIEVTKEFDDCRTYSKIGILMLFLRNFSDQALIREYGWLKDDGYILLSSDSK